MNLFGFGVEQFAPLLDAKLGIHVRKVDEMDALMRGLTFTLQTAVDECYTFVVRLSFLNDSLAKCCWC